MAIKIIQFINLLAYGFISSQPMFYLLAMSKTQKNMQPSSYVELRKLLNENLQVTLRIAYYTALLTSPLLFCCWMRFPLGLPFITSTVALTALLMDMVFLFKGDIPINKTISTWTPNNYPADWKNYRHKWFEYYHKRQVVDLIGFISLLAGAVFQ